MNLIQSAHLMDCIGMYRESDILERFAAIHPPRIYWKVGQEIGLWQELKNTLGKAIAMLRLIEKPNVDPKMKEWAEGKLEEYKPQLKKAAPALLSMGNEFRPYLEELSKLPGFEFLKIYEPQFEKRQTNFDF